MTSSLNKNVVEMDEDTTYYHNMLRKFLFKTVYGHTAIKKEEEKIQRCLYSLFEYFSKNISEMPSMYQEIVKNEGEIQGVSDYISGMTDVFATTAIKSIFIPNAIFISKE